MNRSVGQQKSVKCDHVESIRDGFSSLNEPEDQLLQSEKMEAIGRLAGRMAHDFNNLLTVISGHSELVAMRLPPDSPLRRNVEEIRKASERAAALTHQLLVFSGKQIVQPKVFDLNSLVTDKSKMIRHLIGEDIELVTVLEPALERVEADVGQIDQVIMNLVLNARDAMPQGGKLTIKTVNACLDEAHAHRHLGVQPSKYVMLVVTDTGGGMDAKTRSHIFEPFFTTKAQGKGTGLGLSTVYGNVKQNGGQIRVDSEPRRGTSFKIYMPAVPEPTQMLETNAIPSGTPQSSETVLVVEDEEPVRKLACQNLV